MAKRFIDTGIFDDNFFMNLSPEGKLFFLYLITKCDHAGIIDLNLQLTEFQIGIKGLAKGFLTLREQLGNRLIFLCENYFFLPKFIKFQYPNGLNMSVKAHESVIKRLIEFDLFDLEKQTVRQELRNSYLTVQDKDKDKDKDKDIERGVGETKKPKKTFTPPTLEEVETYFEENGYKKEAGKKAWMGYDVANWVDSQGKQIMNWKQKMIHVWFKDENKIKSEVKSNPSTGIRIKFD